MKSLNKIKQVSFLGGFELQFTFEDGFSGTLDLKPALWGELMQPLLDPSFFKQVTTDGYTISWPNGADFCPDTIRLWCEAGRILKEEEMIVEVTV